MGEPLLNPRVFDAFSLLTDKKLFNMSQRRLSVSTVGIIPGIERLTREYPEINLAFSLHSPFPEQRDILVPSNKNYPLHNVMEVLDTHAKRTRRKIFLAYLVLVFHSLLLYSSSLHYIKIPVIISTLDYIFVWLLFLLYADRLFVLSLYYPLYSLGWF